ncbi:uncharacterized protein LOC143016175 [Genypterus blacodes]|uniref:uncharacterized protein LOC143016175 n=1 Tax=Genypterus blacodes TaxID=154954 RepID=UPI003F769ED8
MPQSDTINVSRRRATCRGTRSSNGTKVTGPTPGTGLVNGAVHRKPCPAAASGAGDSRPAGTPAATKPLSSDEARKPAGPKKLRGHGGSSSALTDSPVNGSTSPPDAGLPRGSDLLVPDANQLAAATTRKKRSNLRRKKRDGALAKPLEPKPAPVPPQERGSWEKDIQKASLDNWRKMCFGNAPYGPEDLLSFALRDLALKQRPDPPAAGYRPATRHPRPLNLNRSRPPTAPEQFADADE